MTEPNVLFIRDPVAARTAIGSHEFDRLLDRLVDAFRPAPPRSALAG
jgi:hypothetical protein